MNIKSDLKRLLTYDKQELLNLVSKKDFGSEKEMEDYVVRCQPQFFNIPCELVQQQIVITPYDFKGSKRCDIAILSRFIRVQPFSLIL